MKERNIVRHTLDLKNPPPLTAEQRKRLNRLAAKPDSEINFSDIPEMTGNERWTRPGALVPTENKQQVTLRLDADVLKFFKKTGRRYQSRINAALREYIQIHREASRSLASLGGTEPQMKPIKRAR